MPRPQKRSFSIKGHRTSVSLEEPFWDALREVAQQKNLPIAKLVETIDASRGNTGLSTALRIYLFDYFKSGKHLERSNVSRSALETARGTSDDTITHGDANHRPDDDT